MLLSLVQTLSHREVLMVRYVDGQNEKSYVITRQVPTTVQAKGRHHLAVGRRVVRSTGEHEPRKTPDTLNAIDKNVRSFTSISCLDYLYSAGSRTPPTATPPIPAKTHPGAKKSQGQNQRETRGGHTDSQAKRLAIRLMELEKREKQAPKENETPKCH